MRNLNGVETRTLQNGVSVMFPGELWTEGAYLWNETPISVSLLLVQSILNSNCSILLVNTDALLVVIAGNSVALNHTANDGRMTVASEAVNVQSRDYHAIGWRLPNKSSSRFRA